MRLQYYFQQIEFLNILNISNFGTPKRSPLQLNFGEKPQFVLNESMYVYIYLPAITNIPPMKN